MAHPSAPRAAATLQTVVRLRWLILGAQAVVIEVARRGMGLEPPLGSLYALVALSAVSNLAVVFLRRPPITLSQGEATAILLFDTAVTAAILLLAGGTANPVAAAILVPPVIAATATASRQGLIPSAAAALALLAMPALSLPPPREMPGAPVAHALALTAAMAAMVLYLRRVAVDAGTAAGALLAAQDALDRERRVTDLTALAAAAAHELNSPLGTIKLAAHELAGDLPEGPARDDARLIADEADRCGRILRSLGGSREGTSDPILDAAPLGTVLREAAAPHDQRGVAIRYDVPPEIERGLAPPHGPEVVHGLRNVIQNAVDHARSGVDVEARRTAADGLAVTVRDDGPGFPPQLFERLGDPVERSTNGMGLGLFIARTLLERTGAQISFGDARDERGTGAIVRIEWPAFVLPRGD